MPTYLDTHNLGKASEDQLKQAQNAPMDEFGVTHKNIRYNKEENRAFCILDASIRMLWKKPTKTRYEMQLDN
jgi:hypothetical protein